MSRCNGAELIVRLLERQGVRIVSGIPGGANLPMYDALSKSRRIRHILARHEQGAGFIAQGMARVTGAPGVCLATSGPGATNILTAIADAKLDSIPLVCITGQVAQSLIGTDAFQEVDTYGMTLPCTKHNFLVRSAEELLEAIPAAFQIASSGRRGPVVVDVPKDVQMASIDVKSWPAPGVRDPEPALDADAIARAAKMIDQARRPILYLGGGVIAAEGSAQAVALAERAGLPAVMTLMALGAMPVEHPLNLGMLGMHAARSTNMAMERCDLLIAAGARFDDRATGQVARFCPGAKIIHIDIDPSEMSKIKSAHVAIAGDVAEALEALVAAVKPASRGEWVESVQTLRREHGLSMPGAEDPRTPYGLIVQTAAMLDEQAIIATDVGQHQMWTAQAYPFRRPRHWLTSGGLGTMGFGLPAAIGAALACPDRDVVCFSGDGSLLMNIQELATAAEENLNLKVILFNNNSLGLVHQQQDLFYGGRIFAADYRASVDFVKIAEGFGVRAFDLGTSPDPLATLAAAISHRGPCLVNAPIDPSEKVFPMVPPGAANIDMIDSAPLAGAAR